MDEEFKEENLLDNDELKMPFSQWEEREFKVKEEPCYDEKKMLDSEWGNSEIKVKEEPPSDSFLEPESIFLPVDFNNIMKTDHMNKVEVKQEMDSVKTLFASLSSMELKGSSKCCLCSFSSIYPGNLSRHMRQVHVTGGKSFQCSHCGQQLKRKHDLLRHVQRCHTACFPKKNFKKYRCRYCSFVSLLRNEYDKHKRQSHPESVKWVHCSQCDYKSISKASVIIHLKNKHKLNGILQNEVFSCPECKFTTNWQTCLKDHMWALHKLSLSAPPPNFMCHHCGYSTFRKSKIRRHIVHVHVRRNYFSTGLPPRRRFNRRPVKYVN